MKSSQDLRGDVLRFIKRGIGAPSDEDRFRALALRVFRYQYTENHPYRRFCQRRGRDPDSVSDYTEIPAVPTAAFKEAALVCGNPDGVEAVFRTSGTTQGPGRRGVHYVRELEMYRASALPNFGGHVLPDGAILPMLILGPDPNLVPNSSLAWMLDLVRREFGGPASEYYVDADGLRLAPLLAALEASESKGTPVALLGTAAAFSRLLEKLVESGVEFQLTPGSRVMETGGFKRAGREVPRDEFYGLLVQRLGIPESYCVAEYGMTEMCSQFYENVLREAVRGRPPTLRYKVIPPWVRTQIVDPESLEPLPDGEVGVLRHFDLANLFSVLAIQTDDLGIRGGAGFEILGRATGSELRGCSIAMDEWLSAQR